MERNLKIIQGNVKVNFKDIDTYNFYVLVMKNWNEHCENLKHPNYYNFMYEMLDNLEEFMHTLYKDVISEIHPK